MTIKMRDKILDGTATKEELVALADNAEKMAAVLLIYTNKANWRKMWEHSTRDYGWVFMPKQVAVLDTNMPPEELMESIARQVTLE